MCTCYILPFYRHTRHNVDVMLDAQTQTQGKNKQSDLLVLTRLFEINYTKGEGPTHHSLQSRLTGEEDIEKTYVKKNVVTWNSFHRNEIRTITTTPSIQAITCRARPPATNSKM